MFGEEESQQLVPGSQPCVYTAEEEMVNGHNGDAPPWPVLPLVEEPEVGLIQSNAVLSGSSEFYPGGPRIFV